MAAAVIHLGRALPHGSSSLPGNAACRHRTGRSIAFPYLALHREEFAWPRLLPDAPVGSYPTVSPITRRRAGLFSVALVVTPNEVPGRYPARCPVVFGLSSAHLSSDRPTRFTARLSNYSKDC